MSKPHADSGNDISPGNFILPLVIRKDMLQVAKDVQHVELLKEISFHSVTFFKTTTSIKYSDDKF